MKPRRYKVKPRIYKVQNWWFCCTKSNTGKIGWGNTPLGAYTLWVYNGGLE